MNSSVTVYLLLVCVSLAAAGQLRSSIITAHSELSPTIEWSTKLAKKAQAHADICGFESSKESYQNDLAENLYMVSSELPTRNLVRAAVNTWTNKTKNVSRNCPGGADYCIQSITKSTWRSATKVGCGVATCDKWLKSFLVCRYE